jgi:diaminopimelate decarboxylase
MLNVDSFFDAENIISVARQLQKTARVLIRVNPGLEESSTPVHSYLSTALKNSKFGIPLHQFDQVYSNHNFCSKYWPRSLNGCSCYFYERF